MRSLTYFLLIAALGLSGCAASRVLLKNERLDSVRMDRNVNIRTRIEYVPVVVQVPDQRASALLEPADTSHLETEYAASDAFIRADGRLYHSLRNKPQKQPVKVPVAVVDTTTTQTIDRRERERVEVPVPIPLTRWQRFWLASGKVGWGLLAGAVLGMIIRKKRG